jgi:hypothetical protein
MLSSSRSIGKSVIRRIRPRSSMESDTNTATACKRTEEDAERIALPDLERRTLARGMGGAALTPECRVGVTRRGDCSHVGRGHPRHACGSRTGLVPEASYSAELCRRGLAAGRRPVVAGILRPN